MLLYTLDEFGDFENIRKKDDEPVFVAGLIFDDKKLENEIENERARIKRYYSQIISEIRTEQNIKDQYNFTYPVALHVNNENSNKNYVRMIKEKVRDSIFTFLKKGTYKSKELFNERRQGEYYIFVNLKSEKGVTRNLDSRNTFIDDEDGSNRYENMVTYLLNNVIFNGPVDNLSQGLVLEFPTRVQTFKDDKNLNPKQKQTKTDLKTRGIDYNKRSGNTDVFYTIDSNSYNMMLKNLSMENNDKHFNLVSLRVEPIEYKFGLKDMEFMYLADSLCSKFQFEMNKLIKPNNYSRKHDLWFDYLLTKTSGFGERALIYAYDDTDDYYQEAIKAVNNGDLFKAYTNYYEASRLDGLIKNHYFDKWFKKLDEDLINEVTDESIVKAVEELDRYRKSNVFDQAILIYILNKLLYLGENHQFNVAESERILYKLYDIGISAYTHIGDSHTASKFMEKVNTNYEVGIAKKIESGIKNVVKFTDIFDFEAAEDKAVETLLATEEILKILYGEESLEQNLYLGKLYSSLGQVYGFEGKTEARDYFEQALAIFEANSADYFITLSYYLHHLIDIGDVESYEHYAAIYFNGNESLKKQLKYLVEESLKENPKFSLKFALYFYIKALYTFYLDIADQVWSDLKNLENKVSEKINKDYRLEEHPTELIFKYMTLIAIEVEENVTDEYHDRMRNCLTDKGNTIVAINLFSEVQIAHARNKIEERDSYSIKCQEKLASEFEVFKEKQFPSDGDELYEELKKIFTFMYV